MKTRLTRLRERGAGRNIRIQTAMTLAFTGTAAIALLLATLGLCWVLDAPVSAAAPALVGAALLLAVLAVVNFHIAGRITDPIRRLNRAIGELEVGKDVLEIEESGCRELRRLTHAVVSTVSTMRHLMDDIIVQEQQKRRLELDVLQSQINPHFLYNTLDSVIWMTEAGRYDEAIQMVTSLARLFRISLSRGENIISLADELEHARNYLNIQKIRFKNRFEAVIELEPGMESLQTLKLIVQPLLENSIYHGLSAAEDDGLICVRAYREGGDAVICVADNGMGIRPEKAASLLDDGPESGTAASSGIGLRNVHRRIRLTFGPPYGLTIESEPDEGTRVYIRLPALTKEEAAPYQLEGYNLTGKNS